MSGKALTLVILTILFLLFILQNTHPVAVRFLFWNISMSLALWLILPFILGWLVSQLAFKSKPKNSDPPKK